MDLNHSCMELQSPESYNFLQIASFMMPKDPSPEEDTLYLMKDVEEIKHSQVSVHEHALGSFWNQQMTEIDNTRAFKNNHHLPLARIKRVMKSDKDVKMISADAPIVFSKACELFIKEITLRAWLQTPDKRRTLQRCDIAKAVRQNHALDFLCDVVPLEHHHQHHDHQDEEDDGNVSKEREFYPAALFNQLQFPFFDMNAGFVMKNSEADHHQLFNPSISYSRFDYQPAPK